MVKTPFPFSNTLISDLNLEQRHQTTGEIEDPTKKTHHGANKMNQTQNKQITDHCHHIRCGGVARVLHAPPTKVSSNALLPPLRFQTPDLPNPR